MIKIISFDIAPVSDGNWFHIKFLVEKSGKRIQATIWASAEVLAEKDLLEGLILSEAKNLFTWVYPDVTND
jgi:hypothetical protein